MFGKKDVKLYKFNLKVVKYLPVIIFGLVVLFGLVFGILDSFVLELVFDFGAPILSLVLWIVVSILLGAIFGGLTGVVGNGYLLHIYYLTSINNQLLSKKNIQSNKENE